jgi:hypothetical protein
VLVRECEVVAKLESNVDLGAWDAQGWRCCTKIWADQFAAARRTPVQGLVAWR